MSSENSQLQARIDRAAAKLAALKAAKQAAEAREKTRHQKVARAIRNRALMLWGIALERATIATIAAPDGSAKIRALLEKHLTRENERAAALDFLCALERAAPAQAESTSIQNTPPAG